MIELRSADVTSHFTSVIILQSTVKSLEPVFCEQNRGCSEDELPACRLAEKGYFRSLMCVAEALMSHHAEHRTLKSICATQAVVSRVGMYRSESGGFVSFAIIPYDT